MCVGSLAACCATMISWHFDEVVTAVDYPFFSPWMDEQFPLDDLELLRADHTPDLCRNQAHVAAWEP